MMLRKVVHWLKMTVLVPGLRCEAFRMLSRASVLLLLVSASRGRRVSSKPPSPSPAAGRIRLSTSRGSARHMGQRCWVWMTRSMHSCPKTCAHAVMTGLWSSSRQTGQSSRESMLSWSMSCSARRFSGVRSSIFSASRSASSVVTRSPHSFQ